MSRFFRFLPSRSTLAPACLPICVKRPCFLLPSFSKVECPVFFQFHVSRVVECPVFFQFHSSVPVPFQFLSQFLFQFLLRMCCVFQGFLLQPFFSRKKNNISFFFEKNGLQQNPLKNTAHPQKELEKELGKELGIPPRLGKLNWKNTGCSTTLRT